MSCELDRLSLQASYNEWMNEKLYAAAAGLTVHELVADRGAFFGSIMGTLNHLVVADTIWLQRFASHPARHSALDPLRALPAPVGLDQHISDELAELRARRRLLDAAIRQWIAQLGDDDLRHSLMYKTMRGVVCNKRLADLLLHFFNHQTHHRGQATTLLSQAGVDVGVTDLLALIPDEPHPG